MFVVLLIAGIIGLLLPTVTALIVPRLRGKRAPRRTTVASDLPDELLRSTVTAVRLSLAGEGVPEARVKVERLERKIDALRPRLSGLGSSTYHTVVSTGTKYLPDAVNAYLSLPRGARDKDLVDGQKTAKDLLCEQLDILNAEMQKVLAEAEKVDATALIVNGRFLEEKYGKAEPVVEDAPKVADGHFGKITTGTITGSKMQRLELDAEGIQVRATDGTVVAQYPRAERSRAVEPISAGYYDVEVVDAESRYSKAGRPMIQLTLEITSGPYAGRRLWTRLILTESAQGIRWVFHQLDALGVPLFEWENLRFAGTSTVLHMFLGRRAQAKVRVDTYRDRLYNAVEFLTPVRVTGTVAS